MMGYVIGLAFLLVAFFIVGTVIRKGIYNEVDRLGLWKIDILNRPIPDEIARVKDLNMRGETEQKFDEWRSEWEQIVTTTLPHLEDQLFEAEEASEKYRFRTAKKILASIHEQLESVESSIKRMLEEVDVWVNSDTENQREYASIVEDFQKGKQELLVHRTSLGKAATFIDQAFHEIESSLTKYEEASNNGDYGKARELIGGVREKLNTTLEKMSSIPEWRMMLQTNLPRRINEVELGVAEMEKQGYVLEHLSLHEELSSLRKRINTELLNVEQDRLDQTPETIAQINERLDEIYTLLEKEVEARAKIIAEREQLDVELAQIKDSVNALKEEADIVSLSYRIDEEDLKTKLHLGKQVEELIARFATLEEAIDKKEQSYSSLLKTFMDIKETVSELEKMNEESMAVLKKLRKDELEAEETITSLKKRLLYARRLIQRHNLPGLSDGYVVMFEEADEYLVAVEKQLTKKPLDIPAINNALKKAVEVCDKCITTIEELVETALLSEKVIQYGNRYRSQYPDVEKALIESEAAFRRFDYEAALEIAARAIQKVDPNAFKQLNVELEKIESSISVH